MDASLPISIFFIVDIYLSSLDLLLTVDSDYCRRKGNSFIMGWKAIETG